MILLASLLQQASVRVNQHQTQQMLVKVLQQEQATQRLYQQASVRANQHQAQQMLAKVLQQVHQYLQVAQLQHL